MSTPEQRMHVLERQVATMQQQITRLTDGLSHVPELAEAVNTETEAQRNLLSALAANIERLQGMYAANVRSIKEDAQRCKTED